jgi:carbon-monoxide dehydrogenase large subunit
VSSSLIGSSVRRREDARLVTGQGRYLDDLGRTAYAAAFVRSPHAHARIEEIDVSEALEVDGLIGIYTYDDLVAADDADRAAGRLGSGSAGEGAPGEQAQRLSAPLPLLIPHPNLTRPKTPHALAKDVVHHVGEAIAMVVARDRYIAEDAVDRIAVTYTTLPPVVGVEQARAGAVLAHDDVPGNVAANLVQEVGDADAAIASSPHVLELDLDVERSASTPLEGRGVLARWDADDEALRIWSSTQTSTGLRAAVAAKLGMPLVKVQVTAPDVGGGFGVKIMHPWPEEILIPWAARELKGEVKWVEDRREHFISSAHERQQLQHVRVGFDAGGRILGLDVTLWHDNGAYTPYGIIVPIISSTQLLGPYKPGAYRVEFTSLYTNTVIVTPYRGAGRPQGVFAMERTMDAIADFLGLDRTAVRANNFIQPDEFPYDHHLTFQDGRPLIYDSGDYPRALEMIKKLVGWDAFEEYRAAAAAEGRRVGIGLACYVEGTGVGPYEGAHIQVETSGRVNVAIGLTTQGQGHETVFAQIVADVLGVPFAQVHVTAGDTRRFGYAVGTYASRAAVMSGNAVALAAEKVRDKALRIASDALEVDPGDLEIVDGVVRVRGMGGESSGGGDGSGPPTGPGTIPLSTVAALSNPLRYAFDESAAAATQFAGGGSPDKPPVADDEEPGLEGTDYYSPVRSTFASGMHAAIVETDPETAEITVLKYCVVHDCGTLVNPMIVEGQVHGGVAQGVGGALYERMAYDETGQLLNASFMDFLMPYASEIPTIETDHLETPSPLNPLGIKGAGEAGVIPGMALFAAAIEDAEGFRISRMPISPSELFHLRAEHEAGRIPSLTRKASS